MNYKDKHIIIISADAMVFEDLEYAKTLPHLGRIINEGATIERVRTVYPSVTHTVHASIVSGNTPGATGVVRNEMLMPGDEYPLWYNYLEHIKCDTLFHAAKRAGLTTAASSWPLTAKGDGVIDYLVPGVLNVYLKGREHEPLQVYRDYGASECLTDVIAEAMKIYGYVDKHPEIDGLQIYCAKEIIKRYKPNMLFTHPSLIDSSRHRTGLFTEKVREAVKATDEWVGELMDAVKEAGIEDSTDFVVLSDHGQISIVRSIALNVYLAEAGLIRLDEEGKLISYDAYIAGAGLSAQVYLSRPDDEELKKKVGDMLYKMADEGIYGISEVMTAEEARELYGLYGDFSFVLETDGYTSFNEKLTRPVVSPLDITDYRFGRATHGHKPEKGPQPTLIACGPDFKKGAVVKEGSILDHAPTFAKIMGLELRDSIGKACCEILN